MTVGIPVLTWSATGSGDGCPVYSVLLDPGRQRPRSRPRNRVVGCQHQIPDDLSPHVSSSKLGAGHQIGHPGHCCSVHVLQSGG